MNTKKLKVSSGIIPLLCLLKVYVTEFDIANIILQIFFITYNENIVIIIIQGQCPWTSRNTFNGPQGWKMTNSLLLCDYQIRPLTYDFMRSSEIRTIPVSTIYCDYFTPTCRVL
jgi:hypothetical protein